MFSTDERRRSYLHCFYILINILRNFSYEFHHHTLLNSAEVFNDLIMKTLNRPPVHREEVARSRRLGFLDGNLLDKHRTHFFTTNGKYIKRIGWWLRCVCESRLGMGSWDNLKENRISDFFGTSFDCFSSYFRVHFLKLICLTSLPSHSLPFQSDTQSRVDLLLASRTKKFSI